ncbi:hypothetical protein B0T18DRAFT_422516 [Schizothecium vesticola]|uniref:Uncharacterized protein n=1 Tax=Schizothecium vesticola TaxID=314040 RepID=A0AA40EHR1_9PEZI|nr:hypothetical protein B0T18DRAFT_422516 [Schizothecium vesticola]
MRARQRRRPFDEEFQIKAAKTQARTPKQTTIDDLMNAGTPKKTAIDEDRRRSPSSLRGKPQPFPSKCR